MLRVVETFRATSATTALEDRDPTALLNSAPAIPRRGDHAPDRRPRVRPLPGNCSGDNPWSGAGVDYAVSVRSAGVGSAPPTCRGRRPDPGGLPDPIGGARELS